MLSRQHQSPNTPVFGVRVRVKVRRGLARVLSKNVDPGVSKIRSGPKSKLSPTQYTPDYAHPSGVIPVQSPTLITSARRPQSSATPKSLRLSTASRCSQIEQYLRTLRTVYVRPPMGAQMVEIAFFSPLLAVVEIRFAAGDITKEQYIQVEAYDFHETPILTMTWT